MGNRLDFFCVSMQNSQMKQSSCFCFNHLFAVSSTNSNQIWGHLTRLRLAGASPVEVWREQFSEERGGISQGWFPQELWRIIHFGLCVYVSHSVTSNSETPRRVALQAPVSVGFSRQEYCNGLPFPSPGDLPIPGIEPGSPTLQVDSLQSEPPGKIFTSLIILIRKRHSC